MPEAILSTRGDRAVGFHLSLQVHGLRRQRGCTAEAAGRTQAVHALDQAGRLGAEAVEFLQEGDQLLAQQAAQRLHGAGVTAAGHARSVVQQRRVASAAAGQRHQRAQRVQFAGLEQHVAETRGQQLPAILG